MVRITIGGDVCATGIQSNAISSAELGDAARLGRLTQSNL
jgi:hypothetical protein